MSFDAQVIARDKEDVDARWDRAVLYAEIDEPSKALAAFETIAAARQGDGEVTTLLPAPAGPCLSINFHVSMHNGGWQGKSFAM